MSKTDDDIAIAFAGLWRECKRKLSAPKQSAWGQEGLKGRLQGIEDCAHAAGIWQRFKNATVGKPVRDLPGQTFMLGDPKDKAAGKPGGSYD